jgi:hypothetical protein
MVISGIGVQQILPRSGTGWQGANPSPDQSSDTEDRAPASKTDRAPKTPGTGHIVDKVV